MFALPTKHKNIHCASMLGRRCPQTSRLPPPPTTTGTSGYCFLRWVCFGKMSVGTRVQSFASLPLPFADLLRRDTYCRSISTQDRTFFNKLEHVSDKCMPSLQQCEALNGGSRRALQFLGPQTAVAWAGEVHEAVQPGHLGQNLIWLL